MERAEISSSLGKRFIGTLRELGGLERIPRTPRKPFAMIPQEAGQDVMINHTPEEIFKFFKRHRVDTSVVAGVIYDMFYALDDKEAARFILEKSVQTWGEEEIRMGLASSVILRTRLDGEPAEEQIPFQEFCKENGLEIDSVTLENLQQYY